MKAVGWSYWSLADEISLIRSIERISIKNTTWRHDQSRVDQSNDGLNSTFKAMIGERFLTSLVSRWVKKYLSAYKDMTTVKKRKLSRK